MQATNFHGVLAGIEDYPGTYNDLDYCVEDVKDMRNYLQWYQGWKESNIELLLNDKATADRITNKIENMPNSKGNSNIFHYAGHGSKDGLYTYNGNVSPVALQNSFDNSSLNQYGVILDCCHSGVFTNEMTRGEISTAVKSDETSHGYSELNNGVYSYYMLQGMKNDNADPNGQYLSLEEVHEYADSKVTSYNSSMHPQYQGHYFKKLNLDGPPEVPSTISLDLTIIRDVSIPSDKTVTVKGGATLTIEEGVEVELGNNSCIEVKDGQLNAIGTSSNPIVFTSSGTGDGIKFTGSNYSNNNLEYCEIKYQNNAILITGSGPAVNLDNCYIHDNSSGGVRVSASNSNVDITHCTIDNSYTGVYAADGASVDLVEKNDITNNYGTGLQSNYYSSITVDYHNSVVGSYYLAIANGGTIDATKTWWGTPEPSEGKFSEQSGGSIDHSYDLPYDPDGGSDLAPSSLAKESQLIAKASSNKEKQNTERIDPKNIDKKDPSSMMKSAKYYLNEKKDVNEALKISKKISINKIC